MKLKALYYPYARSFDQRMLKSAILMFDEIWFSDPMERRIREWIGLFKTGTKKTGHDRWDTIKDDYDFLSEKGVFKIFDPCPIVREYDGLMAQSLICDLQDNEFMQLASESASQDYWGIIRMRLPAEEFLSEIEAFRLFGTRFWQTPVSIKWREPASRDFYGSWFDYSSPYIATVEHDYIPVSCGYSVNINHALLLSQVQDLTLFTDDVAALRLLNLKYARAKSQSSASFKTSLIIKRTPEYLAKYNLLAVNIIQSLLPAEELDKRSFQDIVRFKEANHQMLERFHSYLLELTHEISSEPWSETLESEILKLIDTKVLPEAMKVKDSMHSAYEKMFGSIIKKTATVLTPTLVASFLSGLSSGQILTLSCAAVAGALSIALPEIVDLWQDEKQNKRNSLSFLLDLASHKGH